MISFNITIYDVSRMATVQDTVIIVKIVVIYFKNIDRSSL